MYRTTLFMALMIGMSLSSVALMAQGNTNQTPSQSTYAINSQSQNPVFDYSARKLLGYVSEARISLAGKRKDEATSDIGEAMNELNSIRNTRDYLNTMGINFGRVLYGESGSYYIPIADDTYAVRTYASGPFWSSDKATAVRDVELINVDIVINPEKAKAHLQEAEQKIAVSDYEGADNQLKTLLDESLHQTTSVDQPFTRLQDNIYLTRVLIRQQNYDGARFTLRHAKAALADYEQTVTAPDQHANAASLRQEIDTLDNAIQSRDPTLMKQASDKVEQWWNDLKTWTHAKTS